MELHLQRRHSAGCPDKGKDPKILKSCRGRRSCPIWVFGYDDSGNRVRESLGTRDMGRTAEKLTVLTERLKAKPAAPETPRKTIAEAVDAFHGRHARNAPETQRKYRRHVAAIANYLAVTNVTFADQMRLDVFDGFINAGQQQNWNWLKQLEVLKQFLGFCIRRQWCGDIDTKDWERPKIAENEVVPYTVEEVTRIISACDFIGRVSYERLRARAMVLLMRWAGLRVSDVVTLSREHIQGGFLKKRAHKNRKWIRVNLPAHVLEALERLPRPKAAPIDSKMYFASDTSSVRSLVKGAERTMAAVFKLAAVPGAHCHRFRHTLASEILGKGGTIEDAANILADSPATIRRHYAKWTTEQQTRQDQLLDSVHGTNLTQTEGIVKPC